MTDGRKKPSFLITAGPTREYIDPVRFLSNPSSGKMGIALAREVQRRGLPVTLCLGPVAVPCEGLRVMRFVSARDLLRLVKRELKTHDILVMAAAVSDYRTEAEKRKKIKKSSRSLKLKLVRTPDILSTVSSEHSYRKKFLIGFAAETCALARNARLKLKKKGVPLIVANRVDKEKKGFASDTNEVQVFSEKKKSALARFRGKKDKIARALISLFLTAHRDVTKDLTS